MGDDGDVIIKKNIGCQWSILYGSLEQVSMLHYSDQEGKRTKTQKKSMTGVTSLQSYFLTFLFTKLKKKKKPLLELAVMFNGRC